MWTETWPPADVSCGSNPEMCVQVSWGVFHVNLGAHQPLGPAVFASGAAWLGISVEGQPELPRVAMGTTPYAFIAALDGLWIRHNGVNTSFPFQNITVAFDFGPGDLVSATCGCAAGNPQRGFVSSGTTYVR